MKKIGLHLIVLFLVLLTPGYNTNAQLLVNEFSQGLSGSKEYVEFVVKGQRSCNDSCADIRGWIFDDNNGWYGTGASSTGFYRFKNDPVWSCVPYGSIIVVYNPADINVHVPADDPTDANADHVYILPVNSSLIEFNGSAFYSNIGFGPSVDWNGITLNNTNDAVQTIDPNNLTIAVHAVSYGANYYAPVNIAPSGAGQTVYYLTNDLYNSTAAWTKGNVLSYETPGVANTLANENWLNGMDISQGATITVTKNETICAGQLPYQWNGFSLTTGGDTITQYTVPSLLTGCDSTTILNLTVNPSPALIDVDTVGCGNVTFEGQTYYNTTILKDTLKTQYGCDSICRKINIVVHPSQIVHKTIDTFACSQLTFEGITYRESTTLNNHYTSIYGCDSLDRTVHISIEDFKLKLIADLAEPYTGEVIHFGTEANTDYNIESWQPLALFNEQHFKEQNIIARLPSIVVVTGKSMNGCIDSATITYAVMPLQYDVFIPNSFTPNGDGLNDYFLPRFYIKRAYNINRLQIFDRWGKSIFNSTGNGIKWDGNYLNGSPANVGTYHYLIMVKFVDGKEQTFKGDLVLLR
ncbi:MAG: gliding motility-associated C-terminal domain-containing protein [Taibaiella sp.]|jgi:gliding motility-associated-like protein